jgi:hypothetical protein
MRHVRVLIERGGWWDRGVGEMGRSAASLPSGERPITSGGGGGEKTEKKDASGHREAPGIWWHAPSPVELLVGLAG